MCQSNEDEFLNSLRNEKKTTPPSKRCSFVSNSYRLALIMKCTQIYQQIREIMQFPWLIKSVCKLGNDNNVFWIKLLIRKRKVDAKDFWCKMMKVNLLMRSRLEKIKKKIKRTHTTFSWAMNFYLLLSHPIHTMQWCSSPPHKMRSVW